MSLAWARSGQCPVLRGVAIGRTAGAANAGVGLIDFENVPSEPAGPSLFASAGPMQTIVVPGVATITGGVILGNETLLPAQAFGTAPNVYGTAGFGDPTLSSTLTIAFNPAFGTVGEVSFPVFNGDTAVESYVITALDGASVVSTQTLSNLAPNTSSGFGIVDITAPSITSLTIAPTALDVGGCCSGWDFSIDSVAVNESVLTAVGTPEPGSFGLLGLGLAIGAYLKARSRRPRHQAFG
jgi:hypothetical protein